MSEDDIRIRGLHVRTVVSVFQVAVLMVLWLCKVIFMFFITLLKRDKQQFVLVDIVTRLPRRYHLAWQKDRHLVMTCPFLPFVVATTLACSVAPAMLSLSAYFLTFLFVECFVQVMPLFALH